MENNQRRREQQDIPSTATNTHTCTQTNRTEEVIESPQKNKAYDDDPMSSSSSHASVGVRLDSPPSSTEVDSSSTSSTSEHAVDDVDSDGAVNRGLSLKSPNSHSRMSFIRHPLPQAHTGQFHSTRVDQMPMHELQCPCCKKEFVWKAISMDDRRPRVLRCFHRICGTCIVDLNRRNAESVSRERHVQRRIVSHAI